MPGFFDSRDFLRDSHLAVVPSPSRKIELTGLKMAVATDDDVVTPFPGAQPGPDQPRPDARSQTRAKRKTGNAKDPTAALRKRRQRANQDRDTHRDVSAATPQNPDGFSPDLAKSPPDERLNEINAHVTVQDAPPLVPQAPRRHGADVTAYLAAIALAGSAAWFSIRGMVVLFPGSFNAVIVFGVSMEVAKLVTAGWLAKQWRATVWVWRFALMAFVFGLALINAAGVFSQLVAAHVGERGAAQSAVETQDAAVAARIELAAGKVADLDRQIGQIDTAIETAAKKGKTQTALSAMEGQKKARTALAGQREKAAGALAALKTERAQVASQERRIETEAAPIMYVAELLGIGADSERAIRWLIALMVLCCDPLAISLTAAASARR